jgi:hypothetical protein
LRLVIQVIVLPPVMKAATGKRLAISPIGKGNTCLDGAHSHLSVPATDRFAEHVTQAGPAACSKTAIRAIHGTTVFAEIRDLRQVIDRARAHRAPVPMTINGWSPAPCRPDLIP